MRVLCCHNPYNCIYRNLWVVFWGRCGARTHVECHDDGQPSAAGFPPPPLSFLRYDRPMENDQKIAPRRNGENRALWGAAWGGCGREDRGKAWRREEPQIKSNARQFVQFLWDRHSFYIWDRHSFWKCWRSKSFNDFVISVQYGYKKLQAGYSWGKGEQADEYEATVGFLQLIPKSN